MTAASPAGRGRRRSKRARVLASLAVSGVVGCGLIAPEGDELRRDLWSDLRCRPVPVPSGPEDLAIDHATGLAYVASTDRWAVADGREGRVGHLSTLDLTKEEPVAVDVTPPGLRSATFQPQGLGLHTGAEKRLFVVNRRPARDPKTGARDQCRLDSAVEVLALEADRLRHVETIADAEMLVRPNDVAPVSDDAFYVTNDHAARGCLGRNLRDLFGLNRGHLLHYDGTAFRVAAEDLPFANGVAFDPARREVYVTASQAGTVQAFAHPPDGPATRLAPGTTVRLGSAPDNLTLEPDGGLLVAAHPDRRAFLFYARRWFGAERAPSRVVEIDAPRSEAARAAEIFRDDGTKIAAASVAATYRWQERGLLRLVLGAVFGDHVLLCDRPLPPKEPD